MLECFRPPELSGQKRETRLRSSHNSDLSQEGPEDGSDPDGLGGGGHRVPHRVPQPRPGREPSPSSVLLQVHHLSAAPSSSKLFPPECYCQLQMSFFFFSFF